MICLSFTQTISFSLTDSETPPPPHFFGHISVENCQTLGEITPSRGPQVFCTLANVYAADKKHYYAGSGRMPIFSLEKQILHM